MSEQAQAKARLASVLEAVRNLADDYDLTASMVQHSNPDKELLEAAARDIRRVVDTALEDKS